MITRPTRRRLDLVLAALSLSAVMMVFIPVITREMRPMSGFLSVFLAYWVCFCLPVALYFGRGPIPMRLGFARVPVWVPVLAIALPVMVFFGAKTSIWLGSEAALLAIAVGCALINGPLEELAWRRPFRANSDGKLSFELFGLFLFSLWHVPLYLSHGVTFDHDAIGLIGGAVILGFVWMMMTRASNALGWPMLSHACVNCAGFVGLFAGNFGV